MKKSDKKAISLIVLVVTIIVMIVLAGAVILTISNNNIITKSQTAVDGLNDSMSMEQAEMLKLERKMVQTAQPAQVTDSTPGTMAGNGSTASPYRIESIEDLEAFATAVNGGDDFAGKTVLLMQTLDFKSDKSYDDPAANNIKTRMTTGTGYTPIGRTDNPFNGTFDGQNKEIRNMYINQTTVGCYGLFGVADSGVIKNIGVTGNIILNADLSVAGGIVGASGDDEDTYRT